MRIAKKLKVAQLLCTISKRSLTKDEVKQHRLLRKRNVFNICYINEANAVFTNARIVNDGEKIECPTLLFSSNGKQISNHWLENQQTFASAMKAKLVCFDCGHYIHHYKSNEMCREIIQFINLLER